MNFNIFLKAIPKIIEQPLPALNAHIKLAPLERVKQLITQDYKLSNPRKAAVMMLFYPKDTQTYLLLIERTQYPGVHSAQIAFPGGKEEKEDPDLQYTALRETEEEIGIKPEQIQLIKSFTEIYIPPSNFVVTPFLGIAQTELKFILQPSEVANIIELPLKDLLDDSIVDTVKMTTSYAENIEVPAFLIEQHIVWGATGMMLSELKDTLRNVLM